MTAPVRTARVEVLLGRLVHAPDGARVGRIEELHAEQRGRDYVVTEFHLGSGGLRERLAILRHLTTRSRTIIVRWDQIDLSDPRRPRLTCPVSELRVQ
jgi:hypothetical protein